MRRSLLAIPALALAVLGGAAHVSAHGDNAPYVLVSAEFIVPGQPFEIMVADIGQDAPVDFTIVNDERSELLGTTRAAPDGHLTADLQLPADFPVGWAQLYATVPNVTSASTFVHVGERTADTPPALSTQSTAPWWTDPSVVVLAILLIGIAGVVGFMVFRPKRAAVQTVAAPSGRRRSSGKRSRR